MKNNSCKIDEIIAKARAACPGCAGTVSAHRNLALSFLSEAISKAAGRLVSANEADLAAARRLGADEALLEDMRLDYIGIGALAGRIRHMAGAADPTDEREAWRRENGLTVEQLRVPLGLLLIIAGASVKKTLEAVAACIKTGNAVILLRSEVTPATDEVIVNLLFSAFACCGLSADWVNPVPYTTESLSRLLTRRGEIDAAVLLGSRAQNALLRKSAELPVIESSFGTNHIYIDEGADIAAAVQGVIESKRAFLPSAVNTVLVNWMISDDFLPALEGPAMAAGIELAGDARVRSTLHGIAEAREADRTDAGGRLLLITVNSLSDALAHIQKYGAGLCEGIYSGRAENIEQFCRRADAGALAVNAPPAKAAGYEAGLGADLGLSADKLGQRGPMGLARLTTLKYILKG